MKQIYFLLMIISAIVVIWYAIINNPLGLMLMIVLSALSVIFYFKE